MLIARLATRWLSALLVPTVLLVLLSVPRAAEEPRVMPGRLLRPGQWTTGVLARGEVGRQQLVVSNPGVLAIAVQELGSSSPGFDASWILVDPVGNLVRSSTGQADVVCRMPGRYGLLVLDKGRDDRGSYCLSVQGVSQGASSGKRILSRSDELTGSLVDLGRTDTWTIGVDKVSILDFEVSVLEPIDQGFDPLWRLYSPSGEVVAAGAGKARVLCESTGEHTLLVLENGGDHRGTYELTVRRGTFEYPDQSEQTALTTPHSGGGSQMPLVVGIPPVRSPGVATLLNFGQSVADSISPANEVDGYRFEATAGDRIKIRFARTSASGFSLRLRLDDRFGNRVASANGSFGELETTILFSGRFFLSVRGSGATTGTYQLTLQRTNDPGNVEGVTIGDSLARSTGFWTEMDVYQFTAMAGDDLFVRFARTSAAGFSVQLELRDSNGDLVATSGPGSFGTFAPSIASTGDYFLWVFNPALDLGNGGAIGSYQVTLQRTVGSGNVEPVAIGDSLARSTSFWTEIDIYEFTATTNDDLLVRFARTTASGFSLQLDLRDSTGALVDSSGPASFGTFETQVGSAGQYFLWVFNPALGIGTGGATGQYQLTLQRTAGAGGVLQAGFGDSISKTTNFWTEINVYEFTAIAGDRLFVPFARTTASGFSLQLDLRNSAGALIGSSGAASLGVFEPTLPNTGQYFLWVFNPGLDIGGGGATGNYHLTLQRTVDPGQVTGISIGGPAVSGAISLRTEVDIYSFTATAGTDVDVAFTRTSASGFSLEVRLYDAAGVAVVPPLTGTSGVLEATLPATGVYLLWVRNPGMNITGTYSFSLL